MKIPSYKEYEKMVKERYDKSLTAFSKKEKDEYFYGDEAQKELRSRYRADVDELRSGKITEKVFLNGCVASVANCLSLMFE